MPHPLPLPPTAWPTNLYAEEILERMPILNLARATGPVEQ